MNGRGSNNVESSNELGGDTVAADLTPWEHFWFAPSLASQLQKLRWVTAASTMLWFAAWGMDGARWLTQDSQLTAYTISQLSPSLIGERLLGDFSYAIIPWVGLVFAGLWGAGRVSLPAGIIALGSLLALFHRGPLLCGPVVAVQSMLLFYLLLAPSAPGVSSWRTTLASRLIQLHLFIILLATGLQQLHGGIWWNGDAVWWLMSNPEHRLMNLTFLIDWPWIIQLLTHACAAYPLLAAALVFTIHRRWVIAASIPYWMFMGALTGDVLYSATMLGALWAAFPSNKTHRG